MPVQPHPIQVKVYSTDNSTLKSGARVLVRNVTKKSTLTAAETTDANGVTLLDLANLPLIGAQTNEYDQGDKILIITHSENNHDAILYTVQGDDHEQTLYLNPLQYHDKFQRLMQVCTGNTSGTVAYCKIYAFDDGELLAHIETPSHDTQNVEFGHFGRGASGGFVVEREANTLIVTATVK